MGILTPDPGLVFWTTISFLTLLFLLRKYAWRPILRALKVREEYIEFALKDAAQAKDDLDGMAEKKRQMLNSARLEREKIISEAKVVRDEIIQEARDKAETEAELIMSHARENIEKERAEAIAGIREQIGTISLDIAEKILKQELSEEVKQESVIKNYLKQIEFN
ncbi:F0F1 ATP synthase subunit B [Marinilabiliaceae bacterium ANBcel2]|nr:F0F1 ATP synthase subunit B [Marinilabiliaceae bacterium ANBcel2]